MENESTPESSSDQLCSDQEAQDGQKIEVQRFDNNYFDATSIGSTFGKIAYEYLRLDRTKEYIEDLSRELELPSGIGNEKGPNAIVITQRGGKGVTLFHPRLLTDYIRWCKTKIRSRTVKKNIPEADSDNSIEELIDGSSAVEENNEHALFPLLELFDEAPFLLGRQHLYAMQCVDRPTLWKIGVSANPYRRLREVKKMNGNINLVLMGVWRQEADLETAALRALPPPPSEDEELRRLLKSTEFRMAHVDLHKGIKKAVDCAKDNTRRRNIITGQPTATVTNTNNAKDSDQKRRRISLELDEREVCIEKRRLNLEKARWEFEMQKADVVACERVEPALSPGRPSQSHV